MKIFEIGSEYDWKSNERYLSTDEQHPLLSNNEICKLFLRSGRDALRYLAKVFNGKKQRVLMPALCCSCMPEPFETEGYELVYYKIKEDFSLDVNDVKEKMVDNCIFLYMNYFSIQTISNDDLNRIKSFTAGIITVEDITHDFLWRKPESLKADYTVCSIRKWLAIPDGGVVFSRTELPNIDIEDDSYFSEKRVSAMKRKSEYLESGKFDLKNAFREELSDANHFIDTIQNLADINPDSVDVIEKFAWESAYKDRLDHSQKLYQVLLGVEKITLLPQTSENSTLYFPIIVEKRYEVQQRLAQQGVYAPVIWPLPENAEGVCKNSDYVANHMLAIPCDHRYNNEEVEKVISIIRSVMEGME